MVLENVVVKADFVEEQEEAFVMMKKKKKSGLVLLGSGREMGKNQRRWPFV